MSRILTLEELENVKHFSEELGFEFESMFGDVYQVYKDVNEATRIGVSYSVLVKDAYVEIVFSCPSITTDEYEDFIKVLSDAQKIAKELEK